MDLWKKDLEDNAAAKIESIVKERNFEKYNIEVSLASKKGDNYMGIVYRISVSGTKKGKIEPDEWSFILKCCPSFVRKMPVDLYYKKEYFAYTEMLPYFCNMDEEYDVPEDERLRYTPCLGGDMAPMKEFIALDDLRPEGFVMGSRKESLAHDQMVLLIRSLAKLHSYSFALKKLRPAKFAEFAARVHIENEFNEQFAPAVRGSCSAAAEALCDEHARRKLDEFTVDVWDKMVRYLSPETSAPYNVLVHGDCWTNNIMFKCDKDGKPVEARLLDWQVVRCVSPVIDLAYLLFCSADEALRGQHYRSLLDLYHSHLALCLRRFGCDVDECFPEAAFRRHVAEFMPSGLLMAIVTAPVFMSDDEDVRDMNAMMTKDELDEEDFKLRGAGSKARFEARIRGVVGDFIAFGLL